MIGYYDAHLVRKDGWQIDRIELIVFWENGNPDITGRAYANIGMARADG